MCRFKIIFIFLIAYAAIFINGNKLDYSWRGLTKEKFFRDQNGSVTSQVEKATELNLRGNLFDSFLDCSAKLDKLEILDLSQNELRAFYFVCKEEDNLHKLNVSHNKLIFLNDTALTKRITKLQILDLSYNIIQSVDEKNFQHLENLHFLSLNSNPIGNNIHEGAFKNLKSLSDLNLCDISASNLPEDLFTPLISLKRLNLASNPLGEIPALPAGLESLDISGTNIFRLKTLDLPVLRVLTMNSMPKLEFLDLNDLEKLPKLAVLSIRNSPVFKNITELPTRADLLPNLKNISIRNCSVDKLGADLQSVMQKTSQLDLQDNPWRCDCGIKWILSLKSTINFHDHMRCGTPPELRDKRVFEIPVDKFVCNEINYLALWLALGIFGTAGIVAGIAYFAREPLRKWQIKSNRGDTVSYKNITANSNDTEKILDPSDP